MNKHIITKINKTTVAGVLAPAGGSVATGGTEPAGGPAPAADIKRECGSFRRILMNDAGEGFVDVLVKMLIVVVVGAVLLAIMRQAIPQLFTDMITKIRDVFEV